MKLLLKAALAPLLLVSALLFAGPAAARSDDDWVTVKAGPYFTFEAPAELQAIPYAQPGVDAFFGRYEGSRFNLQFIYSPFLSGPDDLRDPRFERENVLIDGRPGAIFTAIGPGVGCEFESVLYVTVDRPSNVSLEMSACANGYAGLVQARRLFESIRFSGKLY